MELALVGAAPSEIVPPLVADVPTEAEAETETEALLIAGATSESQVDSHLTSCY